MLAAAQAAIPPDLLARLRLAGRAPRRASAAGRAGAPQPVRGARPAGRRPARRAAGRGAAERGRDAARRRTLAAAAAARAPATGRAGSRCAATTFGSPASSSARGPRPSSSSTPRARRRCNRLAEAKGAVELLLADCYVRRDRVALLAFRGREAELLLPPTRSLVRAKRSLAGLPGGGGTPLAAGHRRRPGAGRARSAARARRRSSSCSPTAAPTSRATAAAGRPQAEEDALAAARRSVRAPGSPRCWSTPRPGRSRWPAGSPGEMGARYLPLPHADAAIAVRPRARRRRRRGRA